ncbi:MAG: CsgG/HfaB family protein [Gammaproteobacteria bacterium]|nr:CsgG/HfaB family protein [Gammaproteobacteria bacterium]MDH5802665.1 CsgG/HfaB family protein [Gammaproteobacteria bacterium]
MNHLPASKRLLVILFGSLLLSGCLSSMPMLGGGSGNVVTGGAAGSAAGNKNSKLASCDKTLGTLTIFEDTSLPWWGYYRNHYPKLGSTVPVIRNMIQQSNCFVIVERGRAMQAMQRERQLMQAGDLRGNSNFGKGQMAAADYTLSPSVTFEQSNMGRIAAAARSFLPFGGASVGSKSNEASTTLLMIDNRSGVQVSSSVGSAKNFDFSIAGFSWGGKGFASGSGYANSAEGKVIIAAFADSYNQMVQALRNYKPQVVEGGLGTGGALKVDGAVNAQPQVKASVKPKPMKPVAVNSNGSINVKSSGTSHVTVDQYDEQALNEYYGALKQAVEHLSQFAAMTPAQVNAFERHNNTGISLWTILWSPSFSGKLETSKIELESWPMDAKQKGWKILGRKIKKYNKLFFKHRDTLLSSENLDDSVKNRLKGVELVTEVSLFQE